MTYIWFTLVSSKSPEEHKQHLEFFFQRLEENGFIINLDKCEFGKSGLSFLGHSINKHGIRPLPSKVEAMVNMPPPKSVTDLRGFLASINFYRDFIPHAVEAQQHLSKLTPGTKKKNYRSLIEWSTDSLSMFETAKQQLANAPALAYPVEGVELAL